MIMKTLALMMTPTTKINYFKYLYEKEKKILKDIPTLLIPQQFLNNQPFSSCSMTHTTDLIVNQDPITRGYTKIKSSFRNQ